MSKVFKWDEVNGQGSEQDRVEAFLTDITDTYAILQLRHEPEMDEERFMSYSALHRKQIEPDVDHYEMVYAAPLIPLFIEMGVDIWQGALSTNNLPELIRQYGGQISFHGGMDNSIYDVEDWSRKKIRDGLRDLIDATGVNYIIPALTAGGPVSSYDGVYDTLSEEIDALSAELFS